MGVVIKGMDMPAGSSRKQEIAHLFQDSIAEKMGIYLCSICYQPLNLTDCDGSVHKINYCPTCGSKILSEPYREED